MKVEEKNVVIVDYTGKFDDGTVFDSSKNHGKPLEFQMGEKMVIPGFENALIGMEKGQEKEIVLKPEEAYGERREELVQKAPRDQLPKDQEPKEGMMLIMTSPEGHRIPAKITAVDEKEVTLDMNHPLAGKTLHFTLKVVDVKPEGEMKAEGCGSGECGSGNCGDKDSEKEGCGSGGCGNC